MLHMYVTTTLMGTRDIILTPENALMLCNEIQEFQ
jgi:hypothetical protein